jgi:hypothetical protein
MSPPRILVRVGEGELAGRCQKLSGPSSMMMLPRFENCILSGDVRSSKLPVGMIVFSGRKDERFDLKPPKTLPLEAAAAPFVRDDGPASLVLPDSDQTGRGASCTTIVGVGRREVLKLSSWTESCALVGGEEWMTAAGSAVTAAVGPAAALCAEVDADAGSGTDADARADAVAVAESGFVGVRMLLAVGVDIGSIGIGGGGDVGVAGGLPRLASDAVEGMALLLPSQSLN